MSEMNEADRAQLELLKSEILGKLNTMDAKTQAKLDRLTDTSGDHEKRIRSIERWKYAVPASFIITIGTIIAVVKK